MAKYSLSPFGIDQYLYAVEDSILRQVHRNNYPFPTYTAIAPLRWYIATGRCSGTWLKTLLSVRPDVVARRLLMGGNDLEVIERIKQLINQKMEG